MIRVMLWLPIVEDERGQATNYKRSVVLPSVPRVGDNVAITDGGWTEVVRFVWWDPDDSTVTLEFAPQVRDGAGEQCLAWTNSTNLPHAYLGEEDYAALKPAGWEAP